MSEASYVSEYPDAAMQRTARLAAIGQVADSGEVTSEMRRLAEVGTRLDKATGSLRDRLEQILVDRDAPDGPGGATASPRRCAHASDLATQVDHLEFVASRLEDLRRSIDL